MEANRIDLPDSSLSLELIEEVFDFDFCDANSCSASISDLGIGYLFFPTIGIPEQPEIMSKQVVSVKIENGFMIYPQRRFQQKIDAKLAIFNFY
tara:strand:+ start:144 stop:425 length:282 start_codon:yes stop_codon:yes gene_type:complete